LATKKKSAAPKTRRGRGKSSEQTCFVIMPFGSPYDRYYANVYAPAVIEVGLEPLRADSLFRSTPIISDIWRFTRDATIMLADLSDKNPNVFYELGLAHAIGKPVILVSSNIEDVPFDLRALRVLIYDKDDESWGASLKQRIVRALMETLEDLASAVPLPFMERPSVDRQPEDPVNYEFRRIWEELRSIRLAQQQPTTLVPTYTSSATILPIKNKLVLDELRQVITPSEKWVSDSLLAQAGAEIWVGRWINAVKFVREVTNLDLKTAKDFVDRLRPVLEGLKTNGIDPWR
jgi:hypothetical protein